MPPTITDAAPKVVVAPSDQAPARPTRDRVVAAIIGKVRADGHRITLAQARAVDDMFGRAAEHVRRCGDMYYLTEEDMHTVHPIMHSIAPNEAVPKPGSTHDLLGRRHLRGNELAFRHTFGERNGGRYCAVAVTVDSV